MKDFYKDVGSFMIRTPSMPIELLMNTFKNTNNNGVFPTNHGNYRKIFDEAILLASPDLYESLQKYEMRGTVRDVNYLLNSVYKYFSRSCSRCTPFGLFSTVAFGKITSKKTIFELNEEKIERNPLVDLSWLYEVVFMYESRYLKELKYIMDESAVIYRNRVNLYKVMENDNREKVNRKSINYSKVFDIINKETYNYASYNDIIQSIKEIYPEEEDEILHGYVRALIKEGYLISDLRPPLTIIDQFEYFIGKLNEYNINSDIFSVIKKKLTFYSRRNQENKIDCLKDIIDKMKKVYKSKNYLAMDASFDYKRCELNKNEIKKINKLISLFIQFNINGISLLDEYKTKFIDAYGTARNVSIIELIDKDKGLGFPAVYDEYQMTEYIERNTNPWVKFFERKYIEAIRKGEEIEITEMDITKYWNENYQKNLLPNSLEIYLEYINKEGKDIFYLSDIFGSTHAGKSFGRFSHLMDDPESFYERINNIYENCSECESCEFTFLPENAYSANVIKNTHGSVLETSFGVTNAKDHVHRLRLNEILVGLEDNRLYLKSAKNNKRIFPTATNMFNPMLKPKILRLIDDIATDGIKFYNKPWEHLLEKFAYIPTIKYKNFILEQEKWIINYEDLCLKNHADFNEFKHKFKEYKKAEDISCLVNLVNADQKLFLNLEEDRCLAVLQKILKKSETILEKYDINIEYPVKFNKKSYCCELVIPFISTCGVDIPKIDIPDLNRNYDEIRIIEPLNNWLYFKIYGIEENLEYLLGDVLLNAMKRLMESGEIDSYFYIQYKDPEFHLRLRISADNTRLIAIQPKLLEMFRKLMVESIISKYCIDCYELELERYGGIKLMPYAHEVFHKDSIVNQSIIHEKTKKRLKISDNMIALIIIFDHMVNFELSLEDIFAFLNCEVRTSHYLKEFREDRELYTELVINYLTNKSSTPEMTTLMDILSIKKESMIVYSKKIEELYPENKVLKFEILNSLLHMNMNRLFGTDVKFEGKMRELARYILYCI